MKYCVIVKRSMRRDPQAFLWDIIAAADAIVGFVAGKTLDSYSSDLMLRSAVERQFEIVGEALNQLGKCAPELAEQIPDRAAIIAFRNQLIHGYARISDAIVWKTVEVDLPGLRAKCAELAARA